MGWLGKGLAFLLAIILFGVGAWPLSLLIFAALFVPPVFRLWRRRPASQERKGPRQPFQLRYLLGGFLFLLAVIGFLAHGTFSPIVFASLGLLVLFWGRGPKRVFGSGLKPVKESVILRSSLFPYSWAAVAQVKLLTRDVGRALAGVTGTVLVFSSDTPSIYLVFERRAASERAAEDSLLSAVREAAISVSALGAYLLPLDSQKADELLQPSLESVWTSDGDWSTALASSHYDVVCIKQDKGFAKSLASYKRTDERKSGLAKVPTASRELTHPPFLTEVFKVLGSRLTWPHPDQYTAFLSSLLATSNEPIGTRILDAGTASQSQMVLVKSQGSPSVELSRAQLRAVVKMYDPRPRSVVTGI